MILSFEEGNFSGAMLNLAAVLRNLGVPPKKPWVSYEKLNQLPEKLGHLCRLDTHRSGLDTPNVASNSSKHPIEMENPQ